MAEWRYTSAILDLGIGWWIVVSFTLLPLYPLGRSPQCLLDKGGKAVPVLEDLSIFLEAKR
jgi:hypothetical protein